MTREEAIELLEKEKVYMISHGGDRQAKALDIAIKAVNEEDFKDACIEQLSKEQDSILGKVRAEIEQIEINGYIRDVECFRAGINTALNVIDKYKAGEEE